MDLKKMGDILNEEEEAKKDSEVDNEEDEIEDESFFGRHKKKIIFAIISLIVAVGIIVYIVTRPPPYVPPPYVPPATPEPTQTPDPWVEAQRQLREAGIGSGYIDQVNIFEQGNLETFTFRQDFAQVDQPEIFQLPIRIDYTTDSMNYTKHRAVVASGVEVYWIEGEFRGRRVVSTITYSLYQRLPDFGVVSAEFEVVTDAADSRTITNVRPLPPTSILP